MNASFHAPGLAIERRFMALIAALVALVGAELFGQTSAEYDGKAAFIYNFITFTEWPATTFSSAESPYVIGVLGDDPFGAELGRIVTGEHIKSRRLVVRRFTRLEDMHRVHILYLCTSEAHRVPEILRRLQGQPVLTVSDIPGFAEAGGAIGFVSDSRIKLLINPTALRNASLAVSSKLMRLGQIVSPAKSS